MTVIFWYKQMESRTISNIEYLKEIFELNVTASVVQGSEFLTANSEVSGTIPGATKISAYQWIWNGIHSASW
jgi:hypothetical protein